MAARPEKYDVWFVAADTVYKAVPYAVVTGWAEQGRLSTHDKLRPAGTDTPWTKVGDNPHIGDFVYRRDRAEPVVSDAVEQLQPVEMDVQARARRGEEDDDVDMIPLIDISLVLLIFFMMTSVVSSMSPVDVPDMKHAAELRKDADAVTVLVDKRGEEVIYAVRVGEKPLAAEDNNLTSVEEMLRRLDARLTGVERPPEVRIACHKDLPRERVREVAKELEKRKAKDQIAFYGAEVNEKK